MEEAARRYARKILLIHLLLLVLIIVCVVLAARGVYNRAREQAVAQYLDKQELLCQQTSNAIEAHYKAILSSMDILERDQQNTFIPIRIGNMLENVTKLVGHQLTGPNGRDRVLALMVVGRRAERNGPPRPERMRPGRPGPRPEPATRPTEHQDLVILGFYPSEVSHFHQERFLRHTEQFIRGVRKPTIGTMLDLPSGPAHIIAYPSHERQWVNGRLIDELWFIAVVPVEGIKTRFLNDLNRHRPPDDYDAQAGIGTPRTVASLIDERGVVVASSDVHVARHRLAMGTDTAAIDDPSIAQAIARARSHLADHQEATVSFRTAARDLATIEPIPVCDKTWFLLISSPASTVDDMVIAIFRKALWWAIFVVAAMTGLLVSSSTSMIRSQLRMERIKNEIMSRELAQARKIQLAWLPQDREGVTVDVAAVNEPANHVSGDFYDWFELADGRTVITIGDVTGHGMSAAFLMATTQLLIRNTMLRLRKPGACLGEVNRQLCGQVFNGQFVTVCVVVLDPATHSLEVANAGHFAPLLHDGSNIIPLDADSQLVLGVEHDEHYPTESFILPENYTLLLYTDGVVDARSPAGEPFGSRRLRQALVRADNAASVIQGAIRAVTEFRNTADLVDDLTLVAIQGQAVPVRTPRSPQTV